MIIKGTIESYPDALTGKPKNKKVKCDKDEAKKLHYHCRDSTFYLQDYLKEYCRNERHDYELFIDRNNGLKWMPIKKFKKNKKDGKQKIRSMIIHGEEDDDGKFKQTGWYSHKEFFDMMNEKAMSSMPGDYKTLSDFTVAQIRRFNRVVTWCREHNLKYNEGTDDDVFDFMHIKIM